MIRVPDQALANRVLARMKKPKSYVTMVEHEWGGITIMVDSIAVYLSPLEATPEERTAHLDAWLKGAKKGSV